MSANISRARKCEAFMEITSPSVHRRKGAEKESALEIISEINFKGATSRLKELVRSLPGLPGHCKYLTFLAANPITAILAHFRSIVSVRAASRNLNIFVLFHSSHNL